MSCVTWSDETDWTEKIRRVRFSEDTRSPMGPLTRNLKRPTSIRRITCIEALQIVNGLQRFVRLHKQCNFFTDQELNLLSKYFCGARFEAKFFASNTWKRFLIDTIIEIRNSETELTKKSLCACLHF